MKIINTSITGVIIIEPRLFSDERGYFFESFNQKEFEKKFVKRFLYKIMSLNHLMGLFEGYIIRSHLLLKVNLYVL